MFLFCSFVSRPVCFKINQNAPNQLHLVSRNLFLKDEPEEVNFGTHSSVILIGCVYNSRQAAQTTAKLHVDLFQGGGGWGEDGKKFPSPLRNFLQHPWSAIPLVLTKTAGWWTSPSHSPWPVAGFWHPLDPQVCPIGTQRGLCSAHICSPGHTPLWFVTAAAQVAQACAHRIFLKLIF